MGEGTKPPAGWYPEPTGGSGQRYWDGNEWTDQTRDGEPPAPSAPATPSYTTPEPATPNYGTPAPAAWSPTPSTPPGYSPVPAGASSSFNGTPGVWLVIAGAAVFLISLLLPWITLEAFGDSESSNGLADDVPWLVLGEDLEGLTQGDRGTSDMLLVSIPVVVAGGMAIAAGRGKGTKRAAGVAALVIGVIVALIIVGEWTSINGAIEDLDDLIEDAGGDGSAIDGSVGFGLYVAFIGAVAIAVGGFLQMRSATSASSATSAAPGTDAGSGPAPFA